MLDHDRGTNEHGGANDRDQAQLRDDPGGGVEPWRAHVGGDLEGARVKRERGTASHKDRQRDEHGDRDDRDHDEQP